MSPPKSRSKIIAQPVVSVEYFLRFLLKFAEASAHALLIENEVLHVLDLLKRLSRAEVVQVAL